MRARIFVLFVAGIAALALIVVARTALYRPASTNAEPSSSLAIPVGAAERLGGALRIATISGEDASAFDPAAFQALHAYLERAFPRVHAQLRRENVASHSLLYTWQGTDPALKPILLMGHMDVVPVEPGTEHQWREPPFSGAIADGFIWGRGAIDNKSAIVGMLEALDMLLGEGFRPARTIFLAYGHDEETGGTNGAREIAALLERRGVQLEMVLDEGGVIADGIFPGIAAPVALIGIAEKGFASVELTTKMPGGHSSLPPRQSAIGILSAAVARIEANPMPARFEGPTREFFDRVGAFLPLPERAVFANLWLTGPLVTRRLQGNPTTNAMVRTTTAATIFQAGTKDNVLPSRARAVLNFRISPADSVAAVAEHVRRVTDDPRIEVRIGGAFSAEPSAVSSTRSRSFRSLENAVRSVVPGAIVAPYPVVVVTDSRHFAGISADIYRLLPVRLGARELERIHGADERIAIADYEQAVRVYRQVIASAAGH